MKIRLLYTLFLSALCLVVLQSNRNGRATVGGEGVTGAPGDASQGGSAKTCAVNGCHSAGAFSPSLSIALLDSLSLTPVAQYLPGKNYIVRVTLTAGSGAPAGYGFQMIALRDNGNLALNGFSDPGGLSNNYKLKTLANGRTYAEHQTMSTTNTFNVVWKAPAAGSGSVTFYSAGNAVNNNQGNSGDGATNNKLQVSEMTSGLNDPRSAARLPLRLSPNPVSATTQLAFHLPESSACRLLVRDLSGRIVWENSVSQAAGDISAELPAEAWQPGIYLVEVMAEKYAGAVKMLKI
jgi:hypothetical protein